MNMEIFISKEIFVNSEELPCSSELVIWTPFSVLEIQSSHPRAGQVDNALKVSVPSEINIKGG